MPTPADLGASASPEEQAKCVSLAIALARAMKNASFYDAAHPVVRGVLSSLQADLAQYLAERREFSIRLVSGYVVIQEVPLISPHTPIGNLFGACHRRRVESILFRRGVTQEELAHLLMILVADPAQLEEEGGPDRALEARGAKHIVIRCQSERKGRDWRLVHAAALDVLRGAAMAARTGQRVDTSGVQGTAREIVEDVLGDRSLLHNLAALKHMDEYTFIHALDICVLSVELGRHMKLDQSQLVELGVAALLHDVGKVLVPLEILRKPGPLDRAEFEVMSQHPVDGAAMLLREPELPETAAVVAFEHHMRYDLSGYPKTQWPRELNLYSLMGCVTDIYDALTTVRPYRPPLPPLRALELMQRECQSQVQPDLFQQFVRMLGPYPWGTLLGLPEGKLAVVTRPNAAAPENPYARIIDTESHPPKAAETELPLRQLVPGAGEVTVLDPVSLGMDLTAILHGLYGGESMARALG